MDSVVMWLSSSQWAVSKRGKYWTSWVYMHCGVLCSSTESLTLLSLMVKPNSLPLKCALYLVPCFSWIEWCHCVWHPRLGQKKELASSSLSLSLSLSLSTCHPVWESQLPCMKTMKKPYGEAHMARNRGVLPTAMGVSFWKQILKAQSRLQMAVVPTDIFRQPLNSWLTETEIINVYHFKQLSLGVIYYAAIDN